MLTWRAYYRRFLAEFLRDIVRSWKEHLVGLALAVLVLVFQLRLGIIGPAATNKNLEAVLLPYVILGAVLILWHFVRTSWRMQAYSEAELARLRPQADKQKSIDILATLLASGRELYARDPDSTGGLDLWMKNRKEWKESVLTVLQERFTEAEFRSFDPIGPLRPRSHDHAINPKHDRELIFLTEHLERVERIIESNTRALAGMRYQS